MSLADRDSEERKPRPANGEGSGDRGEGAVRPTPVRAVMGTSDTPKVEPELPRRTLELEDEKRWIVRAEGATRSGTAPDSGASLLLLTFAAEEEPDRRLHEVLAVASSLDELTWAELKELFARSRPYREPEEDS